MLVWLRVAPYIVSAVACTVALLWAYIAGVDAGKTAVQKDWDKQVAEQSAVAAKLKQQIEVAESIHRTKEKESTHALAEARRIAEVAVANQRAEYERRVQQSSERTTEYVRMAEAGKAERGNLARHTAELDRSLEEGRQLVQELRTVVELRDSQLTEVGQQLLQTRALLEAGEPDGR